MNPFPHGRRGQLWTDPSTNLKYVCVDAVAQRWAAVGLVSSGSGAQLPPLQAPDPGRFTCGHCHTRVPVAEMGLHIPLCKKGHSPEEIRRIEKQREAKLVDDLLELRNRLSGNAPQTESSRFVVEIDMRVGTDLLNAFKLIEDSLKAAGITNPHIWLWDETRTIPDQMPANGDTERTTDGC